VYEPPRRLVYRTRSAAEVLGLARGTVQNMMKLGRIESWPYGRARRIHGRMMPVYRVIPYRAIRQNLEHRGASYFVHPEPVWKPLYSPAETKVLLDLGEAVYRHLVEERDLELVGPPNHQRRITRLSIDALLEQWEAGELSDLEVIEGELPERMRAPQFRRPVEQERRQCGWCGKWAYASAQAVVPGRQITPFGPSVIDRRVCRKCVRARIETARQVAAGGRPVWVDDAWVAWSQAADALGEPYEGLQANLQAAVRAGVATYKDFRAGGTLWTDRLEERYGEAEAEEAEVPDDEWEWEPPDVEAAVDRYETG
jgi:excisionase family DNA binding protein